MTTREISAGPMMPIRGSEAPWCVDGRADFTAQKGPQMLGGSVQPVLFSAIYKGVDFDKVHVVQGILSLQAAGLPVGVHRGENKRPTKELVVPYTRIDRGGGSFTLAETAVEDYIADGRKVTNLFDRTEVDIPFNAKADQLQGTADCAFSDRPEEILAKALDNRREITTRLLATYKANSEKFGELPIGEMINDAYDRLEDWDRAKKKIRISGEDLISTFESFGSVIVDLQGDHGEQKARVNTVRGMTYDTHAANVETTTKSGDFNLDLPDGVVHGEALNVPAGFTTALSLILYQATEMVLVEEKGNEPLPVVVYAENKV